MEEIKNCSFLKYSVELADTQHQELMERFDCGNGEINGYLAKKAVSDHSARTYLYLNDDTGDVIGFVTLACSGIMVKVDEFRETLPAVEIKYFAVANAYQKVVLLGVPGDSDNHYYVSDELFANAVAMINEITKHTIGASHIILYSVPTAVNFYQRNFMEDFNEYMVPNRTSYLEGCVPMFCMLPD